MGFRNYILTSDVRCVNQIQEIKAIFIHKRRGGAHHLKTDKSPNQGCVDKVIVHIFNDTPYENKKEEDANAIFFCHFFPFAPWAITNINKMHVFKCLI